MAKIKTTFTLEDLNVPIDLYLEKRSTLRVAFGRDSVIVRIPNILSQNEQEKEYCKAKKWIAKKVREKPYLAQQYVSTLATNDVIDIMNVRYKILISKSARKTASGKITNKTITLKLPDNLTRREESNATKRLLSRIFAERHIKDIRLRVNEINARTVQQDIKAVRLKYNKSNWGSCSSDRNINLSSRLLLVPPPVRDYVIIHELCHLLEMNHSTKFWTLVNKYCPAYKKYDQWLDSEGVKVDF